MKKIFCLKKNKGYTLLEIMIVISIIGIFVSLATPSFLVMNQDEKVEDASRSMLKMLASSRESAIKKGIPVYVYPETLDDKWENRWVKYYNGITEKVDIDANVTVHNESNLEALRFDGRGRLYNGVNLSNINEASFLFCYGDYEGITGRRITVNFLGKIKTTLVNEC